MTRKVSVAKKVISAKDPRIKSNQNEQKKKNDKDADAAKKNGAKQVNQVPTSMFFQYNEQLGPPYHVLIDTNFINFSIKNKLEIYKSMMDCLLAKVPLHTLFIHYSYTTHGASVRPCSNCVYDIHTTSLLVLTSPTSPISLRPIDHHSAFRA